MIQIRPKTALISVHDKQGIADFARFLSENGIEILATGGTANLLDQCKIPVLRVEDYTKSSEILGGRVKTLHPKIFAGILAMRSAQDHQHQLMDSGTKQIDMVIVNLYPFEQIVEKSHKIEEAIENIDIGGVSLIRAAAKNFHDVAVITDPADYKKVIEEMQENGMSLSGATLQKLAVNAFRKTAGYDAAIDTYLSSKLASENVLRLYFVGGEHLRYGENPYQKGWFYKDTRINEACVSSAKVLWGKQLSYNNILDANEAFELVKEFSEPCCAIIKHTNPCGVALSSQISEAYRKALECDPLSAFGSVVALNRPCDLATAELIKLNFVELIICPSFDDDALALLKEKKNLRLLVTGTAAKSDLGLELRSVVGGLLVQSRDFPEIKAEELRLVTKRKPSSDEIEDMLFAVKVARHIKSNSVVFVKNRQTVGIGAGQMSRVDSVKIAIEKSQGKVSGSVMCSDAFFPFRDGVDEAASANVSAIIEPGGSIRDEEVIAAADEHGISMVFSGVRLFKH